MKHFWISFCALALCIVLVGCGTVSELPTSFSMGTQQGNVYENPYIGLGCKLTEDYTFTSADEIADLNEILPDMSQEKIDAQYKNADTIYLMQANNLEGGGVGINLENTKAEDAKFTSAKAYLSDTKKNLPTAMEAMGFTDVTINDAPVTFAGVERDALQISATIYEDKFFQNYICYPVDQYLVIVSYGAYGEDVVKTLTDAFYAV